MDAFLINISSFPTIIFTIGLGVVIGFWFLVILGLFDLEFFDIEVDLDIDADISQVGGVAGLLTTLGLTGVPITVVISLLILNSWFICYFASKLVPNFPDLISLLQTLLNLAVAIISFLISIPITARMIRPLKGLFKTINQEPISKSLIGKTCRIRSSRVDEDFGEAECIHNGASLIIKVRTTGDNSLKTGQNAVLIEHKSEDTFFVISEEEFNKSMT
ncbi:OB-fold-containig protein [Aliikangiella coralliicola]|uniref:DUF1449 family protein n=1 Tax=Aliikangiella coralliicola TaxID=2592383 RepID=A0A545UIK0_9GAMM|nr:OB-fold-containig protein [Aliikangiella coralliicola]TQV89292.1 hypothetical protein FLL46_03940 [Aliikangiella coralliicola]